MSQFNQENMDKHLLCPRKLRIEPGQPDATSVLTFGCKQSQISSLRCKNYKETTILP